MDYQIAWLIGIGTVLVICGALWAYGRFLAARDHGRARAGSKAGSRH